MAPAHWVHDLSPFLIRFTENFGIRYYGLAYVLGFVGAAWLMQRAAQAGRARFGGPAITDLMTYLVIGVLVGGRLGYFLLYHSDWLGRDPLAFFRVWEGGMASHGGFLGALAAMLWWARRQGLPTRHITDVVASTAPLGLMLGRIANFINGELWGKVSYFKYAVIFPQSAAPGTPPILIEPRHASQLYQAALEGALLLAFVQWRFWKSPVVRDQPGRLTGEFLVAYALLRMAGEVFREPDEGVSLLFGLSRGTFYSLFFVAAGLAVIAWSRKPRPAGPG